MDNQELFNAFKRHNEEKAESAKRKIEETELRKIEDKKKEYEELIEWLNIMIKDKEFQDRIIEDRFPTMRYYDFSCASLFSLEPNKKKLNKYYYSIEENINKLNNILKEKYSDDYISYCCEYISEDRSCEGDSHYYTAFRIYWKFNIK